MQFYGPSALTAVRAALVGLGLLCAGCTTVKFVQKNPYTGETWTVYQHLFGSDSITYCPPYHGVPCREATFVDGPAPQSPPAAYAPVVP